jgi:N6-L-threonylcarbamoyladenine synthase
MTKKDYILGIDTSCDDTSMALLRISTKKVVASVISSQIKLHAKFGGIMPELASRAHMENLHAVFKQVLLEAGIQASDLGMIAVTKTPGLMGCLLVGTSFAQGLAYRLGIPLQGVNHLEAHLFSPFIGKDPVYPFLGLVVSGGHTSFYRAEAADDIKILGQTVDDAAGEAFDKCAKMMGLGYPGGPVVDKRAKQGNDEAYKFVVAKVKMGAQYLSFSGLKTQAHYHVQNMDLSNEQSIDDMCASLQKGIVAALTQKMNYFIEQGEYSCFVIGGGVAMNSLLRERMQNIEASTGLSCKIAAPEYCTDNGAMIAYVALLQNKIDELFTLNVEASQKIQARKLKNETIGSKKN